MATYFHVTSSLNRDSIRQHGLDWTRMGVTHGVAGVMGVPLRAEAPGTFLCRDQFEVDWFAEMAVGAGHETLDVWEVSLPEDADFVEYEGSPGYEYHPNPIPPSDIRLVRSDWSPDSRFVTE